jgi:hypothetical protein
MPDFDTILQKAEAFAGLIIFLAGLAACYLMVAFLYFDFNPSNWGGFGRVVVVVAALVWAYVFADAVKADVKE